MPVRKTYISGGKVYNQDDDASFSLGDVILDNGAQTIAGVKTFSDTPKTDAIAEKTADAGVTVDGILMKDSLDASGIVGKTTAQTLTNKRITKRVGTTASSSSLTINTDSYDIYTVTALAVNMTVNAPSGTPTEGQSLIIRIKDNGTSRTLSWNAIFRASPDVPLPTATIIGKTMYLGFIYNATDSKWDFVSYLDGF